MAAVRSLGDNQQYSTWFEDASLLPNCAPEMAVSDASLETNLCDVALQSPIIVNAMTGGTDEAYEINRRLASVARRHGLAMALGSGTAAVKDPETAYTYRVAREVNPEGVIIANVGMGTDRDTAAAAVHLVGAQLLQVHWNVAQELFMAEGDRDFTGALRQFEAVVAGAGVPVIAKEVGQGIAAEQATQLMNAGACAIDVGGRGGTNFIAVEAWRREIKLAEMWQGWGLSTAATVCEVVDAVGGHIDVVASGGMRTADELVKAMALGAKAVGLAGPLLRFVSQPDWEQTTDAFLDELHWGMRMLLVLTGCRTWTELRRRPVIVTGRLREWLVARGREPFLSQLQLRK